MASWPTSTPSIRLFPNPRNRLAHEIVGIRALLRPELLHAAAVHFGDVEVALLIDAHSVHAPQCAWEHAERAPRVEEMAFLIVLEQLVRAAIEGPDVPIGTDVEQMQARRIRVDAPGVKELAVLVEHLHAMVVAIVDEDT